MDKIKLITGIILINIGLLAFLLFFKYSENITPYTFYWHTGVMATLAFGTFLIRSSLKNDNINLKKVVANEINRLKRFGDKIKVNLDDCEIVTNNYTKDVVTASPYNVQVFDALYDSNRPNRNIKKVNVNQSIIIFETDRLGRKEKFKSLSINKDEITLRFLLAQKKETLIYVDRNQKDKYYFDLEFLYD